MLLSNLQKDKQLTKQTVCMILSKQPVKITHSNVFLGGEELELVQESKYLGVILDSSLSFKKYVKKISKTMKYNLSNFKQIRPSLTTKNVFACYDLLSHGILLY